MNSNWFKLAMKITKVEYGKNLLLKGVPIIFNKGGAKLKIGENVTIKSSFLSNLVGLYSRTIIVTRAPGAEIEIGDNVGISGATIYARKKITIGENTCIGGNCKILDNDFHPIEAETRNKLLRDENGGDSDLVPSREIKIGKNCFIGCNSIILKGTVLGDAFKNSGKAYDDLSNDGVHPNDAGQEIYFETVKAVIDDNVAASTGKMSDTDVINVDVHEFDNFVWYDASTDFERVDDTTFTISTSAFGILGIDYTYESGDNKADIYVDGELFESPTVTFDYDFSQRHILVVSDDCTVKNEIKVVFNTKEQADGFKGMCFSWE